MEFPGTGFCAMSMKFHVLASGSSGNACVLEAEGLGVLIDFGVPFHHIEKRLRRCGLSLNRIRAVLLTHTHGDHWQTATLVRLARQGLPLYCHAEHGEILANESRAYAAMRSAGQVRFYETGQMCSLLPDCRCLPIAVPHDGGMTCGFRFEGSATFHGPSWVMGYATDLGCWSMELASLLRDVDVLALEFNHDVALQLKSGRHPLLIRRVLSDVGHLSNDQAADLCATLLEASEPGRLQALVQLHLSRECNRAELARVAAQQVLDRFGSAAAVHTTTQARPGPTIRLGGRPIALPRRRGPRRPPSCFQPLLPYA
jgi:phosphoribosyl 1,2-cyclic phosphodiesterase